MTASGTVVELRVHGVSGAPPEALLGCPVEFIERQAGDDDAAFYRRQPWLDEVTSPTAATEWRRVMEAYSWGTLTSGRASRALWLLFLPFILIDLAHWMLPPAGSKQKRAAVIAVTLLRLIALSLTLTLMLATAVAVMDVIVWQCVGLDYCSAGPLAAMTAWRRGWQLAAGAVPLLAVIVALWWLGSEELDRGVRPPPPDPAVLETEPPPLAQDTFWNPDDSVLRLRYCHVMAWMAGMAAVTLAAPLRYAATPSVFAVSIGLLVANGVILVVAVAATASSKATARGGSGANRLTQPLKVLRRISLGLLGASLIWVGVADAHYPSAPTHLPWLHGAIYVLFAVQVVMFLALFGCTGLSMRGAQGAGDDGYRVTLGGYTAPFVALLAWVIGGGFSVGIGLLAAQAFGKPVLSATARGSQAPLIVPPPYVWASVATVVTIAAALVIAGRAWFRVLPQRTADAQAGVRADYPGVTEACEELDKIARFRALASLTDLAVRAVAQLALVTVAAVAVMLVVNVVLSQWLTNLNWPALIFGFSVFITAALASGLVALAVAAYRNRNLRRTVAVLWDVVTFWPRANHPLTPPSYGARTVWDIRLRLAQLVTMAEPTRVVLVAHSQGTVIAAATLLQADTGDEHYPLLTFGSPLRRLYAQSFPAYFGRQTLEVLRSWQVPRRQWINMWAYTDPIGSWIFDRCNTDLAAAQRRDVDWRLLDVASAGSMPVPGAPICGHSGFWKRSEYTAAVDALQSTVLPEGCPAPDTRATAPPTETLL